jgi:shikimate kinase
LTSIALVGLPGSGKTTVGKLLARRLGLDFVDSDQVIEERVGCPIRSYWEQQGEQAFRDLEETTIQDLTAQSRGMVLATGGGSVLRESNRQRLRAGARVVYLRSSPEQVYSRVRHNRNRPLLQVDDPMERLRSLHAQRDPLYRETAHIVVDTARPSLQALVQMIVMQLELAGALPKA